MRRATALLARREQAALAARRGFAGASSVKKVLVALYPDATTPQAPARDSVPKITGYANGATAPTPKGLAFIPGAPASRHVRDVAQAGAAQRAASASLSLSHALRQLRRAVREWMAACDRSKERTCCCVARGRADKRRSRT